MATTWTFTLHTPGTVLADVRVVVGGSPYDVDALFTAGGSQIVTSDPFLAQALTALRHGTQPLFNVDGVVDPEDPEPSPRYPVYTRQDDYADGEVVTWDSLAQEWVPSAGGGGGGGFVTVDDLADILASLQVATQTDVADAIAAHAAQISSVHGAAADQKLTVESIVVDPPPGSIPDFGSVALHGHSWPAGTSLAAADRFGNQLAETLNLGGAFTNYAVNSACISATNTTPANGIQNYGTSLWMMRTFRPSLGGLIDAANRTGLHVLLSGINDLAALGAPTSSEIDMTVRAMETWFARLLANDFFEDNNLFSAGGSHQYGANWVQNTATYTSGTTNRGASITPGQIEIAVLEGFPGGDIFLQFMGAGGNPARGATHTIYIDSVEHHVFDSRGDTSGRNTHCVTWIKNVAAGDHYIQVLTGAPNTSTFYDGWGFIAADSPALGVAVKSPRLTAAGLAAHSNQYTNANIDTFNAAIDTMIARFADDRLISANPSAMNEDATKYRTDQGDPLHPNEAGNDIIETAIVDALEAHYA